MFKTMLSLAALAGPLLAGGFYLQLGNPEANPEARQAKAVLVVQATGCHDPASATLTATAITRNGAQMPLKVTKLSKAGSFAITQELPKTGKFVLHLVARNGEQFTNTLVPGGPDGVDRAHAKFDMKPFDTRQIEAMLD